MPENTKDNMAISATIYSHTHEDNNYRSVLRKRGSKTTLYILLMMWDQMGEWSFSMAWTATHLMNARARDAER